MIYLCTCPPAMQQPSAHYYRTSATFPPQPSCRAHLVHRSLLLLPSLRLGAGLSSTIHSFSSTRSSSIRAASRPATLSNHQPPLPTPQPPFSVLSERISLRNQTTVGRFWFLESFGSAGRRIVETASAGTERRRTNSGWNLHLSIQPTQRTPTRQPHSTTLPRLSCISYLQYISIYCVHLRHILLSEARQTDNRSIFTFPCGPDTPDLLFWIWETPIGEIPTQREFEERGNIPQKPRATQFLDSAKLDPCVEIAQIERLAALKESHAKCLLVG